MSNVGSTDLAIMLVLAFDFLVAAPAGRYPLWTVHDSIFRAGLYVAFWIGLISAVGLPVWIVVRLLRETTGKGLKVVELVGALCWLLAAGYLVVVFGFTVI